MMTMHLALDLEGTLIESVYDPKPRPGLREFLDWAGELFGPENICLFTAVPFSAWLPVSDHLVESGAAPAWFATIRYLQAEPPAGQEGLAPVKDLTRVHGDIEQVIVVDDFEEYILPDQRHRWIWIDERFGDDDSEFQRVRAEIEKLIP